MINFDPNNSAPEGSGLFALPFTIEESSIVIVPVAWDATSSQARASSGAPEAIYAASKYVELFDPRLGPIYNRGIAMDTPLAEIAALNSHAIAMQCSDSFQGNELTEPCKHLNQLVASQVNSHLSAGRRVGLLGGDHASSYGAIEAHLAQNPEMGILQIDAHCDLRREFDGIVYSHASIMYNVIEHFEPSTLIQVGVRALCDFESDYSRRSNGVRIFFDTDLHKQRAEGTRWAEICEEIAGSLPREVYVSLDIDGLEPSTCPGTGTPVPGGLAYNDVIYLLHHIRDSGRDIVGFDLVEVGANEFDANIAAHLLYQLCGIVS